MINKEELKQLIKELREVVKEEGLKVNDSEIWSEANSHYRGMKAGEGQDKRAGIVDGKKKFQIKNPDFPATEEQITYFAKLGGNTNELDPKITKGKMSELIDAQLKKKFEKKSNEEEGEGYL